MYDDIEADFWKEHFSHVLHKNMVRIDAEKLTFDNCAGIIEGFKTRHPDLNPDINFYPTYATFELFITSNVKLRLYIQNQVKGSLLQFDEGDYVKIVDAKFPYNPFPEIEEFLSHMDEYCVELNSLLNKTVHSKKQMKVAQEFIKAKLMKKFNDRPDVIWNLVPASSKFTLKIIEDKSERKIEVSPENFISVLENL